MGNDCEEHTGNMLLELDIRLNSAYTQGHLKATTHAFLTWREKPPPSLSRTHNKMDWATSGAHLVSGCSLNAESSGKLASPGQEEAETPASCLLCHWFCVCPWSLFCLPCWSWPWFSGGESRHLPGCPPIWTLLWLWHTLLTQQDPKL